MDLLGLSRQVWRGLEPIRVHGEYSRIVYGRIDTQHIDGY